MTHKTLPTEKRLGYKHKTVSADGSQIHALTYTLL